MIWHSVQLLLDVVAHPQITAQLALYFSARSYYYPRKSPKEMGR